MHPQNSNNNNNNNNNNAQRPQLTCTMNTYHGKREKRKRCRLYGEGQILAS